jgi:hypothetical protein
MATSVFPAAVSSSINANAITCVSANTIYGTALALDPAIYTVTCASTTIATVEFLSGANGYITNAKTATGSIAVNLASAADRVRIWTNTGSNIVVTITKTAAALTNNLSGTLDTITTIGSSTYTGTSTSGYAYAMVIGGGGGGGGGQSGYSRNGGGGGGGGCAGKIVTLTGSMAVVVGAAGARGVLGSPGTAGTAGGSSTFAGMTATGGSGGAGATTGGDGADGASGTASGGTFNNTATGQGSIGGIPVSPYSFISATPGTGGSYSYGSDGGAGSGYGAGGGAGGGQQAGGAGAPGVVYVLRF